MITRGSFPAALVPSGKKPKPETRKGYTTGGIRYHKQATAGHVAKKPKPGK